MTASRWRWVVVVMPRGDVVRLTHENNPEAPMRYIDNDGVLEDGTPVVVNGTHIALAWKEPVR